MSTSAENITFMLIRGVVALAIVGVGFFCLAKGLFFFAMPIQLAQNIQVHLLGLELSASGLGAVIFGSGIVLCYIATLAAPKRLEHKKLVEGPHGKRHLEETVTLLRK